MKRRMTNERIGAIFTASNVVRIKISAWIKSQMKVRILIHGRVIWSNISEYWLISIAICSNIISGTRITRPCLPICSKEDEPFRSIVSSPIFGTTLNSDGCKFPLSGPSLLPSSRLASRRLVWYIVTAAVVVAQLMTFGSSSSTCSISSRNGWYKVVVLMVTMQVSRGHGLRAEKEWIMRMEHRWQRVAIRNEVIWMNGRFGGMEATSVHCHSWWERRRVATTATDAKSSGLPQLIMNAAVDEVTTDTKCFTTSQCHIAPRTCEAGQMVYVFSSPHDQVRGKDSLTTPSASFDEHPVWKEKYNTNEWLSGKVHIRHHHHHHTKNKERPLRSCWKENRGLMTKLYKSLGGQIIVIFIFFFPSQIIIFLFKLFNLLNILSANLWFFHAKHTLEMWERVSWTGTQIVNSTLNLNLSGRFIPRPASWDWRFNGSLPPANCVF